MLGKRMLSLVFALALICSFATPSLAYSRLALPSGPIDVAADPPEGTVQFNSATYSVDEHDGTVTLTVTRTDGTAGAIVVNWACIEGTATSPEDYTADSDTLTFPDGSDSSQTIIIDIIDDSIDEDPEDFTVSLTLAGGSAGAVGTPDTATVTISDIFTPGLAQFKSAIYTVSESGISKVIYLTRTGGTDGDLTATVQRTGGTADAGEYTFDEDTVTWPSGNSVDKYVTVLVTDDAEIDNPAPTVILEITASDPVDLIGAINETTLTITDNDFTSGTVQFGAATYTVTEGTAYKDITLTRSGGSTGALSATVEVVIASTTAVSPAEYTFTGPPTVSWIDGDTASKTVRVTVVDDTHIDSPAKIVVLSILSTTPTGLIGAIHDTTLTILDNDAGAFYLNPITVTVVEGDELAVKVYRTKNDVAASVTYTVSEGTADAGDDYTCSATATLSFAVGVSSKTFYIEIDDDNDPEEAEKFYVDLTACTSGWTIDPAKDRLTVTIAASDMGTIEFDPTVYTVDEDEDYVTLTLVRDTDEGAASVAWETAEVQDDNAADQDKDYEGDSGTVTFNDGKDTATIKVYLKDDTTVEGDEVFEVILSSPDGAELGHDDTATVTIKDNDGGVFEFSQAAFEANEDAGTATITVKRTGGLTSQATVKYATADGTGVKDVDYRSAQGTLTFAKNITTQTFTVSLIDDSITDGNKTVKLSLNSPSGGTLGTTKAATLTIKDDDNEVLVILTVGQSAATIDGRAYTMDTKPYINATTGRTMVPLRFIAEAFGAKVSWDQATKAATIDLGTKRIVLTIGRNTALVNGVSVAIDAPPELLVESGRTMVPLRFISENLGATVVYDNITKQITIRMKR